MKQINLFFKLTLFMFIGILSGTYAQTYTVTGPVSGQGPLLNTESTSSSTGWVLVHDDAAHGGGSVNSWSHALEIGFPFEFFGAPVDSFCVSKNYLLTFNTALATTAVTASISTNNSAMPDANLPDSTIAYLWCGFGNPAPLGSNDDIWTKTFGTAPNRQLWVKNFSFECEAQSFTYNFVVLEEGTNNIYVVDARNASTSAGTRTVGVQLNGTTAYQDASSPNIASINGNVTTPWPTVDYWAFMPPVMHDVGAISVDGPASDCALSSTETVTVSIENFGLAPQTSIPVMYSLNGGAFVSGGTWTGTLSPGNTTTHTFTADLSAFQTHDISVITQLATDNITANDTVDSTATSYPTYDIFDTLTVCFGDTFTFPDGMTMNNITTQTTHVSNLTTVGFNCDSVINTTLMVYPDVPDAFDTVTVCSGGSHTYHDGTTDSNIVISASYTSSLQTATYGCDSNIITTVMVEAVDVTTSLSGLTITANAVNTTYDWLDCDNGFAQVSPAVISPSFTATTNGNYAVEIRTANSCVDTSACVSIMGIGIDEQQNKLVKLYPNPTTGNLYIEFGKRSEKSIVQIYNLQGQVVFNSEYTGVSTVDLNLNQPAGTYLVVVSNEDGLYRERVVIK